MIWVIITDNSSYHEKMQRGTEDFPVSLYCIDNSHVRYQMRTHWHSDFEIIRVLKGRLEISLNGRAYTLTKGNGAFIPSNVMHGAKAVECEYECIVFSKSIFGASARTRALSRVAGVYAGETLDSVRNLFETLKKDEPDFELRAVSLIYEITAEILKRRNKIGIPAAFTEKIKPAISVIEDRFNTKLTLNELAEVCGMSPNYFSRKFKEITNQTPFDYIMSYRVEQACEMLSEDGANVTEACFHCGFNDLSYFINIFKRYKGISPKMYAKQKTGEKAF